MIAKVKKIRKEKCQLFMVAMIVNKRNRVLKKRTEKRQYSLRVTVTSSKPVNKNTMTQKFATMTQKVT